VKRYTAAEFVGQSIFQGVLMATAMTPAVSGAKAGFWIRVVAYIIDAIILGIVTSVVAALFRGNTSARGGIQLVLGIIYFVYFWSAMGPWPGQTPGMKILNLRVCLLYTSPSPRDLSTCRMPSSA